MAIAMVISGAGSKLFQNSILLLREGVSPEAAG
jgi:hypothetical protein